MLLKSFIVFILTYCLPILFTSIYSQDKKALREFFKQGDRLGLDIGDLDRFCHIETNKEPGPADNT